MFADDGTLLVEYDLEIRDAKKGEEVSKDFIGRLFKVKSSERATIFP